jgi:hypothetical protein
METHFHGSSLPAEALAQAGVPSGHGTSVWFGILNPFTFDLLPLVSDVGHLLGGSGVLSISLSPEPLRCQFGTSRKESGVG